MCTLVEQKVSVHHMLIRLADPECGGLGKGGGL